MKERLTVNSASGLKLLKGKKYVELLADKELTKKAINRLAEYEDLEEQGLLKRLPCKVGDDCYFIIEVAEKYKLFCGQVRSICIDNDGIWFSCRRNNGLSYWLNSKKLFFTYAEAEKKLEELKEKKND